MAETPTLTDIKWHKKSRTISLTFAKEAFDLPLEYLRVYSPSAEVQGHGPGQETLVSGKRFVNLSSIDPMGNYAIKLVFDDGHDTGLYTWNYLYDLSINYDKNWQKYLQKLALSNKNREGKDVHVIKLT